MLRIIDVKFLISDEHNSIENEFNVNHSVSSVYATSAEAVDDSL